MKASLIVDFVAIAFNRIVVDLFAVIHATDVVLDSLDSLDSLPVTLDRNDLDICLVITLNRNNFHVLLDEVLPLFDDRLLLLHAHWRPNGFIRMNEGISGRERKSTRPPLDLMEIGNNCV